VSTAVAAGTLVLAANRDVVVWPWRVCVTLATVCVGRSVDGSERRRERAHELCVRENRAKAPIYSRTLRQEGVARKLDFKLKNWNRPEGGFRTISSEIIK